MPGPTKSNAKAPTTPSRAPTPPCTPIDESPRRSVTPGDGYQHSELKELVEALRETRVDSTTSKPNPSEDTAGGFASPKQDGRKRLLNNASKLKPQEQEISFSRNPESESPVLMDKYMPDIPPTWMECDPIFMDNEKIGFDPAMKECSEMRTPKASKENMEQSGTPVVDAAQYAWGERKPSPTSALADADSWVAKARKERGKPENYVRARAIANPTDSFEGLAESSQAQNA
ncbi:hypothetical protein BDBG_07305 [Blastomyces gilchristii SLH14081]|uniref:Uncharacterized protein n=1 Tax=Blastomyces gilchristii (strain SLH14081) TaxID=559298 RepID=A0A179UXD0_BLAGS|nr:uncharacterized protein BDBG_07305 [Blastomyces gilchristii SLH14081]OAT11889.1 hypothetical protein BDBG_07305 [Blastomyces gilchristii SLH14081]